MMICRKTFKPVYCGDESWSIRHLFCSVPPLMWILLPLYSYNCEPVIMVSPRGVPTAQRLSLWTGTSSLPSSSTHPTTRGLRKAALLVPVSSQSLPLTRIWSAPLSMKWSSRDLPTLLSTPHLVLSLWLPQWSWTQPCNTGYKHV